LNLGLQNIDGEYVSFLDHDDIYYPNMGSLLIEELTKEKKSFAFGDSVQVEQRKMTDFSGKEYLYSKNKNRRKRTKFNKLYLLLDNFIPFNSFVMRTSLVGETTFDERLEFLEDWDFLKKISLKEEFSVSQLKQPVSEYRRRYDETDTYNKKTEKRWRKARKITDSSIKGHNITTTVEEVLDLREEYIKQIREYEETINRVTNSAGYKAWSRIERNKLFSKTVLRLVREIRHLVRD
jgi:glycosyltransferase involved in cell wall biosynthesis